MRICTLVCCLAACSSKSNTAPLGDCQLDVTFSGGATWDSSTVKAGQLGCGASGSNGTALNVEAFGTGSDFHEIGIEFAPALAAGQTGVVAVTISVTVQDSTTAGHVTWKSAAGACSLEVTKNLSTPDSFFKNKYVIGGNGSCAADLAPVSPNTLPAVTLDAFSFQSF